MVLLSHSWRSIGLYSQLAKIDPTQPNPAGWVGLQNFFDSGLGLGHKI